MGNLITNNQNDLLMIVVVYLSLIINIHYSENIYRNYQQINKYPIFKFPKLMPL